MSQKKAARLPGPPCKRTHHLQKTVSHHPITHGAALRLMHGMAALGAAPAAIVTTLLEGWSKGHAIAVHGCGTTAPALLVVMLPWMPEMLRAFAPIPASMRRAEMLRTETTVLPEA
jgi:hypothetical protein